MIDAEAKPVIAARRHHESLDLVCGYDQTAPSGAGCIVHTRARRYRKGLHHLFWRELDCSLSDITTTAASIRASQIIETSYCRRSFKTVPDGAAIGNAARRSSPALISASKRRPPCADPTVI